MALRLCCTTVKFALPLGVAPRLLWSKLHISAMLVGGEGGRGRSGRGGWGWDWMDRRVL
jgi:hypothetical protein